MPAFKACDSPDRAASEKTLFHSAEEIATPRPAGKRGIDVRMRATARSHPIRVRCLPREINGKIGSTTRDIRSLPCTVVRAPGAAQKFPFIEEYFVSANGVTQLAETTYIATDLKSSRLLHAMNRVMHADSGRLRLEAEKSLKSGNRKRIVDVTRSRTSVANAVSFHNVRVAT